MKNAIWQCIAWMGLGILLTTPALARDVDKSLDAVANGRVSVSNIGGSVEVTGWSRNVVQVTGKIGDDVQELIFERDGKDVTIKVKVPKDRRGNLDVNSELHVSVPLGNSVDIGTVSSDITVKDVQGEQDLQTVSGDIVTGTLEANIDAETVSGNIRIKGVGKDTKTEVSTVSGDIDIENLAGELETETVSGDITIKQGTFGSVDMNAVNGDVAFAATLRKDGDLHAETVNGKVNVSFSEAVSARFEIETFNGKISNCFGPDATRTSKYAPGWKLDFTEGEGDGRVRLSTLNGGITLCKQ